MDDWIPFLQTGLWVALIVWLVSRYNTQVVAVLNAIQDRITKGSSVKAGPFELGQDVLPQNIEQQKKRLDDEVQQLGDAAPEAQVMALPGGAPQPRADFRSRYLLAEELVMRELQTEFDAIVNRQVRAGGVELDGMFAKEGVGYGVEVKYVRRQLPLDRLLGSLSRLRDSLQRLGWRRFNLILALVCEADEPLSPSYLERIQSHLAQLGGSITVRVYTLQNLAEKFGIELNPNERNA